MSVALISEMVRASLAPARDRLAAFERSRSARAAIEVMNALNAAMPHLMAIIQEQLDVVRRAAPEVGAASAAFKGAALAIDESVTVLGDAVRAAKSTGFSSPEFDEGIAKIERVVRDGARLLQKTLASVDDLEGSRRDAGTFQEGEGRYVNFDEAKARVLAARTP
jgi:hypothetical protein